MVDKTQKYTVPEELLLKYKFNPEECMEMTSSFKNYDKNGDNEIDEKEFV